MHGASRNYRYVWDVSYIQPSTWVTNEENFNSRHQAISGAVATYLYLFESYGRQSTLASLLRETCRCTASHLPLGVTNEERDANLSCIKQFLAPLPGTQVCKIGELHTIFYLCFLVLLVYLSVFTFVSLVKNTKNSMSSYLLATNA